jgi:hypothetical protein
VKERGEGNGVMVSMSEVGLCCGAEEVNSDDDDEEALSEI